MKRLLFFLVPLLVLCSLSQLFAQPSQKESISREFEKIKGVGLEYVGTFAEDMRVYDEITSIIPILSTLLKDINTLNPQKLSANNFAEIKDAIIKTILAEPLSTDGDPIIRPNTIAKFIKMPAIAVVIKSTYVKNILSNYIMYAIYI